MLYLGAADHCCCASPVRPGSLIQCGSHHLEPSGSRAVLPAVYRESHFTAMTNATPSKAELRTLLRQRRRNIPALQREQAAAATAARIRELPGWQSCQRLALYSPADAEIDPQPIARAARARGIALFLPVIQPGRNLLFARWEPGQALHANHLGIPEPPADAERCPVDAIDIILLPLVGWDRSGSRLGMGGGFYDRTLHNARPGLVTGLGYAAQESPRLPRENWDIGMDYVLTEEELVRCTPAAPV